MAKKVKVNLTIDKEVVEKAKELGINMSQFCENMLKKAIKQLSTLESETNPNAGSKGVVKNRRFLNVGPGSGFEPEHRAPQAIRTSSGFLSSPATIDWHGFKSWLFREYRSCTARDRLSYARKFAFCLLNRDFSELRKLNDDKRVHVLKALSALAKFVGVYDDFRALRRNYGLKWSGKNSDDVIIARLTKVVDSSEVYEWIRNVKVAIPEYAAFMDFATVTGLRYEEAVNAWNLIIELTQQGKLSEYYKEDKQVLEHFRFKDIFIRRSKKAFVSFVSKSLIARITESERLTVNVFPGRLKRRKLKLRFGDIRELHASVLTKYLRQPEIDFIHGRVSTSVFMRNYFNPAWISDLKQRTLKAASELLTMVS